MKEANWYTEREFFLRARDHAWDQNQTGSLQGLSTPSTELTKHIDVFQWGNEGRRGSAPLQIHMASRAQPACSSAPKVCAETPLRKNPELDHWNCGCSHSRRIHPLAPSLAWIASQAICTQDNPDGKLEAASYYFIITARIMTGPERLIAAGGVNGQGTKTENKDEAWPTRLCKRCAAGLPLLWSEYWSLQWSWGSPARVFGMEMHRSPVQC